MQCYQCPNGQGVSSFLISALLTACNNSSAEDSTTISAAAGGVSSHCAQSLSVHVCIVEEPFVYLLIQTSLQLHGKGMCKFINTS